MEKFTLLLTPFSSCRPSEASEVAWLLHSVWTMPFIDNLILSNIRAILPVVRGTHPFFPLIPLFRSPPSLPPCLPACPSLLLALCPLRLRGVVEIVGMPGGPGPPLRAAAAVAGQVT